ncbi:MAG: AmmeMemoRadiSam system protein A, partial [Pyrinomonadaceae bacterium]
GWCGQVVALGYSYISNSDHLRFGECVRKAADASGRPVALIASGDLSHRLKPNAPAGYNPNAFVFDEEVVDAIQSNMPDRIVNIDPALRRLAGECGYRSMLIAIGATHHLPLTGEVLHYEAPFGVGYMVAQLTSQATTAKSNDSVEMSEREPGDVLPKLAREAVETYVRKGENVSPALGASPILGAHAACFVSIKTINGELRGCIGTIEPAEDNLAEELVINAIGAATRDPRFHPVAPEELANLRYSVDVLSPHEPARFEDLDPHIYGVIVEDESGLRRGLLLPDIEGIETAQQQVEIAARKAGIPTGTPLRLSRFRVDRFREKPPEV